MKNTIINCDVVPQEAEILLFHAKQGVKEFKEVKFFWHPMQGLKVQLSNKRTKVQLSDALVIKESALFMNANVLDFLLENQELIPENFKGKNVLFCGTTYKLPCGIECVRDLSFDDEEGKFNSFFWPIERWIGEKQPIAIW